MPQEIDEEKLAAATTLDMSKPPVRQIEKREFPKMVFLHPKDKSKEHRTRIVQDDVELQQALKEGWRRSGHVPVIEQPEIDQTEYDTSTAAVAEKKPK